ncbi:MAG: VCBS repeat-containing protein [Chitinophagales bacterium]|nr:VCBS repeat-containing protein [Chitinophagales bacterium]
MKHLPCLLLIVFSLNFYSSSYGNDSIPQGSDLWQEVKADTFPYSLTGESINTLADIYLLSYYIAKQKADSNSAQVIAQAYYYNLLADRPALCDSIFYSLSPTDSAYIHIMGHQALKNYAECFGVNSPHCDEVKKSVLPLLKAASTQSELMPKEQWKWLYQLITDSTSFSKSAIKLQLANDGLDSLLQISKEGGVINFSLYPHKQNLLISNGVKSPVQVLELDSLSQWKDITATTGLEDYPGGSRLYNIDYNGDGWDDLFIIRKSSTLKNTAKYYSSLLVNQKNGTFKDISKDLKLDALNRVNCACWGDVNGDGRLDVFLGTEFTGSPWLVQQEDGQFQNQGYSYNILTRKQIVSDCMLTDLNKDGKHDLLLSISNDSNKVYIQELVDNQYVVFKDEAEKYQLQTPVASGQIIQMDYQLNGDGEYLLQANYIDDYQAVADILTAKDTVDAEPGVLFKESDKGIVQIVSSPETSLFRAGILIYTPNNNYLLGAGGQNTESIYPLFVYQLSDNGQKISLSNPDLWPSYIHSATAYADNKDQPVLIFKGGGNYPFMENRQESYRIKMPNEGRFERIFDRSKTIPGSKVQFTYISPEGQKSKNELTVMILDSRGYYALQEWIWVPQGAKIEDIKVDTKKIVAEQSEKQEVAPELNKGKKGKKR